MNTSSVLDLEQTLYVTQIRKQGLWKTFGLTILGKSKAEKALTEEKEADLKHGRKRKLRVVPKTYADAYKQGIKDARAVA